MSKKSELNMSSKHVQIHFKHVHYGDVPKKKKKMSCCDGLKRTLALNLVEILFGTTAREIAQCINDYGPVQLGFINFRTGIKITDIQTICMAFYTHGVVNINGEGKRATFSFSPLPLFLLACPSILLDEVRAKYNRQDLLDVLQVYMREGICSKIYGAQYLPPSDDPIDFETVTDELKQLGFLHRGIRSYSSFTSQEVFNLERKYNNLQLNKKRTVAASASAPDLASKSKGRSQQVQVQPQSIASVIQETDAFCVNWDYVVQFLRGRYIVNFVIKVFGEEYTDLIENLISKSNSCCDYTAFRNISKNSDDQLRMGAFPYPRYTAPDIYRQCANQNTDSAQFFSYLEALSNDVLGLIQMSPDGSAYDIKVPNCIRQIQKMYANSFAESTISPMHGRVLETLQDLEVADTRQLEDEAIVSDKEARCAMYNLYRFGLTQIQAIPKGNDRMIGQMVFVWRYNEDSVIAETANNIGRVALNLWDKITSCIEESDQVANADSLDREATIMRSQEDKNLSGFHSYFIDQMRVYILLTEM